MKAKQDKVLKLRAVKTNLTETVAATSEKVNKLEVTQAPEEPFELLLQRIDRAGTQAVEEGHKSTTEKTKVPQMRSEFTSRQKQALFLDQKPPLDDTSALELHKSKSYIVSLIDKALSKELGTVPGDKTQEVTA